MALLVLCACDVKQRVLIVGDSNAGFSMGSWAPQLYGGWQGDGHLPVILPTAATMPGSGFRDSALWVPSLNSIHAVSVQDASVLNLGLNDCLIGARLQGEPVFRVGADYAARIDAVLGALPAGRVVLIDVPFVPNGAYSPACEVQVNLALQAATNRSAGRVRYINVNLILNTLAPSQRYQADGMHYSEAARYAIGREIVKRLEE